jgi:4-hydroxy-2-oxoheptanedioate aldolase
MKANFVRSRLKEGKPSVGSWVTLPDPFSAEMFARIGFDWLLIDLEHNPISIESAALVTSAIHQADTVPLVRIPLNSGEHIKRVLDMGAWGILVPMVNSREEAELAVRESRYYPLGSRSVGGRRHAQGFQMETAEYFSRANDEILVVVQIEHIDAINCIDDILSVPGIDACYMGPIDLMASMGMAPDIRNMGDPRVIEAIQLVKETALKYGVAPGVHANDADTALKRIEEGYRFITIGSDMNFMLTKARAEVTKLYPSALGSSHAGRDIRIGL